MAQQRSGCLIAAFVTLVLAGLGGYLLWERFISPYIEAGRKAEEYGDREKLRAKLVNRGGFTPPADRCLADADARRYLAILDTIQPVWQEMRGHVAAMDHADTMGAGAAIAAADRLIRGVLGLIPEMRLRLVQTLNRDSLSIDYYDWIRIECLAAAHLRQSELDSLGDADLHFDSGNLRVGSHGKRDSATMITRIRRAEESAPAANTELVAPYRERLLRLAAPTIIGIDCD